MAELNSYMVSDTGQDAYPKRGAPSGTEVLTLQDVGVQYQSGIGRENLQSRVFEALSFKKRTPEKVPGFWALRKFSFTGYKGEILGIIGANGAGKSTLCQVIAKILGFDEGMMNVQGRVSALLSLGTGFNAQLTGRENIFLNGMMLGFSRKEIEGVYDDIVEFSEIEKFIDQPLKTYSSGMRSRLAFSVGAMIEPDILILDEALSAGDTAFGLKAGNKLHSLILNAKMVIVVTHKMDFVETYCTSALWLDKGQIKKTGTPAEVVAAYKAFSEKPASVPVNPRKIQFARPCQAVGEEVVVAVSDLELGFDIRTKAGQKERITPLNKISFSIKKGEVVSIIGRNGQGKTTLCRVLSGILKQDKGVVRVNGTTTALLTFGAGFNLELAGVDNIFLNGMMLGMSKKRLKTLIPEITAFAELEKFIDQPVKKYSSGMRSRLAFSIAVMLQPDIFIIDEALNAGDISFAQKASEKIQSLMESAKAVIVVTHSLKFVENVCTRALWLDNGGIRFDGTPEETTAKYLEDIRPLRKEES